MYSPHHRLDTPPPASQFRRPWSPDPNNPLPPSSFINPQQDAYHHNQRREPSDVSVEALDLADYAQTLARNNNNYHNAQDPYPYSASAFRAYGQYPPSPPALRPFASRDSLPSLVSASASSSPSFSTPISPHAPYRPPFSLPPSSYPHQLPQSYASHANHSDSRAGHFTPPTTDAHTPEIDIAQFPAFSRAWYKNNSPSGAAGDYDPYSPLRSPNSEPKLSPFDPAYRSADFGYSNSPPPSYPHISSYGSPSSRDMDVLPWSADPPDTNLPLDAEIKEERIRMLEREFGKGAKGKPEEGEHMVGSVDSKGRLITQGPKKRLATRWLQVLLALLAGGASIYSAVVIKPASPPAPQGKPPIYILYVLSILTFLLCTYLFLIYPLCCGTRKNAKNNPYAPGPGGMMVLPVQTMPGGKKAKKGGKKKKGGSSGDVQVNLIVDPTMFGGGGGDRDRERSDDEYDEEYGSDGMMPGSYTSSSSRGRNGRGRHNRPPKRRGVFAGLALEAQWKRARKWLKWGMLVDVCAMILWGGEFVLVLIGKRCPPGGFEGWCDAYNLSTAAACLLCSAFGLSVFFDIKDLHGSSSSPRTRT